VVGGEGMLVAEVEVESREVGIRVWHGVGSVSQSVRHERVSDGVSRWVQADGHRMNCRQRRHISTAYLPRTHTRARRSAVEDAASTKQRRDQDSHDNRVFINRYLHEPLGFHVTAPVLTRVDHGSTDTRTGGYTW
jgi:hypothetical protein